MNISLVHLKNNNIEKNSYTSCMLMISSCIVHSLLTEKWAEENWSVYLLDFISYSSTYINWFCKTAITHGLQWNGANTSSQRKFWFGYEGSEWRSRFSVIMSIGFVLSQYYHWYSFWSFMYLPVMSYGWNHCICSIHNQKIDH